MNIIKIIFLTIVLTLLLSIVNSLKFNKNLKINLNEGFESKEPPRYTVFNSEENANFASIDLDTLKTTTLATVNNAQIQNATYNRNTSQIIAISRVPGSETFNLFSVDIKSWEINTINYWNLNSFNYSSIESDQSEEEYNLFATLIITGKNEPETFTIAKISSHSGTIKIIDTLNGNFDSSCYHFTENNFLVHHSNSSGWFLNHYNKQGKRVYTSRFNLSNINTRLWNIIGTPYAMTYSPSIDVVYAANNLQSDDVPSSPSIFYLFFSWDVFVYSASFEQREDIISIISMGTYPYDDNVKFFVYYTRDTSNYPSGVAVYTLNTMSFEYNIVGIDYPLIKLWSDY